MIQTRTASAIFLPIGLLAFCLLMPACEGRRADKAYQHSDYEKTVKELRYLANEGDPRAQYDLGVLYDQGQGVPKNSIEARAWYTLAAEQGEPRAQYNLGLMYANGEGVPQNYVEAYYWISLSAAQGNAHALDARDYYAGHMTADQLARAKQLLAQRARPKK